MVLTTCTSSGSRVFFRLASLNGFGSGVGEGVGTPPHSAAKLRLALKN
jgi:hypothetical protein